MFAVVIVVAYLLFMIVAGVVGYRLTDKTPVGYFLAGRGVGPITLFFTLIATNFSSFFFLGFAGAGYRIGYSYYPIMAFGTAFVAVSFYFIGHFAWRLGRRHGYITPPEMIADRIGSRGVGLLFLAVMVVFTVPYLAIQPIGAGYLLSTITNGAVPYRWGATILTACMVAYVFLGGMRSVAITDVAQGIMMFALTGLAVVVLGNTFGGIIEANEQMLALRPELFSRTGGGDFFTGRLWFSYMILFLFAVPMFPQVFMRFFIPQSSRSLKIAATLYPVVTAILFIGPVFIGVVGHLAFPDLEGTASDQILPMMLAQRVPSWLTAFVMVGALAAFMSTMDSQLLALSSMLTRDVYVGWLDANASIERQVRLGRILVVGLSVAGLLIALNPPDTLFAIATQAFTGLAVLFPTTVAALHWTRATPAACTASIIVNEILLVGFHYQWLSET